MFDVVIYSVLGAFYLFIVLSQMLVVILENRQPVKTVAWLMVLFSLPVIGLVIYFFFGRNRKREHFVSRACASQLARRSAVRFYQGGFPELPAEHKPLIKLFRRQSGSFPYPDNKMRFFISGEEMLDNLLRDIAAARHHIHVEFYIIEDDKVGQLVREALAAKAREGVSVRLVYDDVGCWNVKNRFFKQMETDGIQVAPFLPVRFPKFTSKVDFRNHRKIVVIDGIIGYVGGMNLAERYFYQVDRSQPVWRDTHVRIMGNAVGGLQRAFLSDWYVAAGQTITDQVYYPREEECRKIMACDREPYVSRNALIQIVTGYHAGNDSGAPACTSVLLLAKPLFHAYGAYVVCIANGCPGGSGRAFDDTGAYGQAVSDVGLAFVPSRRDSRRSEGVPLSEGFPALQDVGVR